VVAQFAKSLTTKVTKVARRKNLKPEAFVMLRALGGSWGFDADDENTDRCS
jgi:hypothetical protein